MGCEEMVDGYEMKVGKLKWKLGDVYGVGGNSCGGVGMWMIFVSYVDGSVMCCWFGEWENYWDSGWVCM